MLYAQLGHLKVHERHCPLFVSPSGYHATVAAWEPCGRISCISQTALFPKRSIQPRRLLVREHPVDLTLTSSSVLLPSSGEACVPVVPLYLLVPHVSSPVRRRSNLFRSHSSHIPKDSPSYWSTFIPKFFPPSGSCSVHSQASKDLGSSLIGLLSKLHWNIDDQSDLAWKRESNLNLPTSASRFLRAS